MFPGGQSVILGKIYLVVAVIRIPPLSWAFRSSQNPKCGLLMELNYGPLSEELTASMMWNLGMILRRQSESRMFNGALHDFLVQFQELERRWRGYFEHATENILASAARLQLEILRRSEPSFVPVDLSSETTVIALALHLLLVVQDIRIVDGWAVPCTEEGVFADSSLATFDGGYEYNPLSPFMRLHKKNEQEWTEICLTETSQKPSYSLDASPNVMMEYIIQSSFRLLDAQDPRHWPTVLFIILILYLCLPDMSPDSPWMSAIEDASKPLLPLLTDLARYYYISTDGGRLMSDSWAEEDFAARVGHHEESIKYTRMLNELWLEAGLQLTHRVTAPELWAVRLPVKISNGLRTSDAEAVQMIEDGLLQFSFENGPPVDEPAAPKPDPIQQALEETVASTQAECVKLAEKVAETQRALEITQAELARTQEQLESSRKAQETATVDHRVALEAAQRESRRPRPMPSACRLRLVGLRANRAVCILSVVYGSRFYDNKQSVIDRLRYLIERHEEFKITNDVCEDDPLSGTRKMLVVVYRFTESSRVGRIRVLAGWDGDSVRFDALDSM
ncbi:hypothetical protein Asppvi_005571 [Aspergillus pseudoviridinutans]|uniref:Uncharacterized protein n=1 Tax=Aspergillus pseudoviridinutans TaxID=1517512 RepID=A0A9P3ESW6_9EURO|nr:uncharacterized protein Asppvi_005571 [Aspergillus pseudoviridinutans]GIJ86679.1 hypothetical protein Asppvi_005571 [Aspergillus pseudoviridinutans]